MIAMHSEPEVILTGARILVVDDVAANRDLLCQTLELAGFSISAAPTGEVALELTLLDRPDLVLLDILLPGVDGFEVCRRLKADEATRSVPVLFITAKDETQSLVRAFDVGGVDYITKPFQSEEVLARVKTHLRLSRLTQALADRNNALSAANERLREESHRRREAEHARAAADDQLSVYAHREAQRWGIAGIIGKSATLQRILDDVRRLQSHGASSVLITGESGTGKELIARAIHFGSARAEEPFIPVNCSAIPADLAEATLFGHVRGAFTGAHAEHKGCFDLADGGTLFLDEISEMPLAQQPKLLRVLDDGIILPVGATQGRHVDVRILAASNADFQRLVAAGRFRADVFFRLARFTVEVPPLRARREDIPLLAEHFLRLYAREMSLPHPALSAAAMKRLEGYDFPGNVRELKNIVERALIESGGEEIREEHLHFVRRGPLASEPGVASSQGSPSSVGRAPRGPEGPLPSAAAEESAILDHVRRVGSINNTECRRLLGVDMHHAWYLLHKLHEAGALRQEHDRRWARYREILRG
jgi:DNA-binding NtrC family response regulator